MHDMLFAVSGVVPDEFVLKMLTDEINCFVRKTKEEQREAMKRRLLETRERLNSWELSRASSRREAKVNHSKNSLEAAALKDCVRDLVHLVRGFAVAVAAPRSE